MQRNIPSLDGLRAVAVTIVFLSHLRLGSVIAGGFGVTIFFFLSGFLITTLMLRENDKHGSVAIGPFFLRRLIRLTPPLLVILLITYSGVLTGWLPGELNLMSALSQGFYFFNYYQFFAAPTNVQIPTGTDVLWSLSVEEHYYIIFVFLFVLLHRFLPPRHQIAALWSICTAVLLWRFILVLGHDAGALRIFKTTDTRLDSILFGSVLAYLVRYGQAERVFGSPDKTAAMFVWLGAAFVVLLLCFAWRDDTFRYTIRYSIQGLALMPIFYFAVLNGTHWLFRPLNWWAVRYFGQLSYTFYLAHYVVINALEIYVVGGPISPSNGITSLVIWGGVAAAISLALSAAVFHGIEVHLNGLRHRLNRRRQPVEVNA